MSRYHFRAAAGDGRVLSGTLNAASLPEADDMLFGRGLHPIAIIDIEGAPSARRKLPSRDLIAAMRSVATLVSVGVPVERALATTAKLPLAARLRQALEESRRLLAEGRTLSTALPEAGVALSPSLVGLLRAGERGSRLGPALEELATQLEGDGELRDRIRQALAYPAVLLLAGMASVAVIAGLIVPRFAEILVDLGQGLPTTTRLLLSTSALLREHGVLLLVAAAVLGFLARRWHATPAGAQAVSRLLLQLPHVGPVRHGFASARAAHAFGALLASGAPMLTALTAAAEASGEVTVAGRLGRVGERVARGEPLIASLETEAAFPAGPLQLLAVGESSGHLADMARRAGHLAARDAEARLKTTVGLIEPLLVLLIGGFVAFVALGLLQAVYSLRPVG